jgi:hypothetical protein
MTLILRQAQDERRLGRAWRHFASLVLSLSKDERLRRNR